MLVEALRAGETPAATPYFAPPFPRYGYAQSVLMVASSASRPELLEVLGEMGADARPAAPVLTTLLSTPTAADRPLIARALWKINRDPKEVVPALTMLVQEPGPSRVVAASVLGEIGEEARAAVPALLGALKDNDAGVRQVAGDALKKIDPKAAAKAEKETRNP